MMVNADSIATAVLDEFVKLPQKRRPIVRSNGVHEWVPLSGIVAQGSSPSSLRCLSLATGMKCLPASTLAHANGVVLHDWHAEILAIRAFNHFVLEECRSLALRLRPSDFLRVRTEEEIAAGSAGGDADDCGWNGQPFAWREDVSLYMYCSEAPCGDASMELIMAAQEDPSPWDIPLAISDSLSTDEEITLPGRAYFSQLGVVRRKPARGDAPHTLSKSCSDKLAMKQCTSLLSSLTALLVCPRRVYLRSLVLPDSQHSSTACGRSFSARGRMRDLAAGGFWPGGYAFTPFGVERTALEFEFSRRKVALRAEKLAASSLAIAWSSNGLEEATMGGVLQGRKRSDPRGASALSRRRMWGLALEVSVLLGLGSRATRELLSVPTYQGVKQGALLGPSRYVKREVKQRALHGWSRNAGDDTFGLEESI